MAETEEIRRKRLHMRSIRRGIKEMDLILTAYARARLPQLGPEALDLYERLLDENDQDILTWVIGQAPPPAEYAGLVADLRENAKELLQPRPT